MQAQLHPIHGIDPVVVDKELDLRTNRFVDHWPLSALFAAGIGPIAKVGSIRATVPVRFLLGKNSTANESTRSSEQGSPCNERPPRWHSRSKPCELRRSVT